MNFEYLKSFPDFSKLYDYCAEAEEFAVSKPNISATASRKAMEFIVKMIYISLSGQDYGLTVFEMGTDPRLEDYVNDPTLVNTIHYIRKMGNVAVHEGDLKAWESVKVLESLHFLVGEFCILLGLVSDYPTFTKPGSSAPAKAVSKPAEDDKGKVEVAPELVAKFGPRMRQVRFDVKFKRDEEENKRLYMSACLREEFPSLAREVL